MAVRYEYYEYVRPGFSEIFINNWAAQTFTPQVTHPITRVGLYLSRQGLPANSRVSIRATDASGHPTGEDLTGADFNGNDLPEGDPSQFIYFDLPQYTLQADTKYAIVLRAPSGASSQHIKLGKDDQNPTYPRGTTLWSTSGGASWTPYPGIDYYFEEWGEPPGPTIETQDATGIKSDQATLATKVLDDKGKTLSVRHNYGKTTEYGMNTPWQEGKHTNDIISQTVTELEPETEYHFRGEAIYED